MAAVLWFMGPRGKILSSILLIAIVGLALWQLTSPPLIPAVGTTYVSSAQYSNRGAWVFLEVSKYGRVFLGLSIANLTYPRTYLSTSYSVVISKINETVPPSYIRGFTLKVTSLSVQDNYDGSSPGWTPSKGLPDAVQATTIMNFKTSANHQLRFTVSYEIYNVLLFGYLADHASTRSFNVTQNVV